MWLKFLLGVLFLLSLVGAFIVEPVVERGQKHETQVENDKRLRLLTWNIGNACEETQPKCCL